VLSIFGELLESVGAGTPFSHYTIRKYRSKLEQADLNTNFYLDTIGERPTVHLRWAK
jgi:hypothetical protein